VVVGSSNSKFHTRLWCAAHDRVSGTAVKEPEAWTWNDFFSLARASEHLSIGSPRQVGGLWGPSGDPAALGGDQDSSVFETGALWLATTCHGGRAKTGAMDCLALLGLDPRRVGGLAGPWPQAS